MKVQRYDIGTLAKPYRNPQGFLIAEGIASRVGVFEYMRSDGSIQRELRLPEEVGAKTALQGYYGASLTANHPRGEKVDPTNAKRLSVGTVLEPAKMDGENVRVKVVVKDAAAIGGVEDGSMRALSTGYTVDLEEKAGNHPVYGRYDVIQRNLDINHLALCEAGRAGPVAKIRVDSAARRALFSAVRAERADAMIGMMGAALLTTIVEGHQHSIDPQSASGGIGRTSWSKSEGEEYGHDHEWVRNADGSIAIAMNDGHTHDVLEASSIVAAAAAPYVPATNTDDSQKPRARKGSAMPPEKKTDNAPKDDKAAQPKPTPPRPNETALLKEATNTIARETARADAAQASLASETARADTAEGALAALQVKYDEAMKNQRDDEVLQEKDDEVELLKAKVLTLEKERDDALSPERLTTAVRKRVAIEKAAGPILGIEKMDNLTDRQLMVDVIEKLQNVAVADKSDDYIAARFDVAVEDFKRGARAFERLRDITAPTRQDAPTKSGREKYVEQQRTAWDRKAAAGKGA